MWFQIEDAIRNIILLKEPFILKLMKNYASKRNFFEMVRFDFAVDEDMNVFIMEVNYHDSIYFTFTVEMYVLMKRSFRRTCLLICHQLIFLQID